MINPELKRLSWRNPLHWMAVGFGSGLSPWAPGTMGTLAAIPLYCLVMGWPLWAYGILLLVGCVAGVWICQAATDALGVDDHGGIVWDEIMGFGITMLAAPSGWLWILIGFLLFRLFDIIKPWPIRWFDRHLGGGLGIMLDDVVAGIFAWLSLQLLAHFVLPL
ncbi:MAG: phosphatidylglycerophosphatase A family protein [Aeromonadaceae bacterium]